MKMHLAIGACLLSASPAFATSVLLTFDGDACGGACGDNFAISQTYGDVAGEVDVVYTSRDLPGASAAAEPFLRFWNSDYSDLSRVAWANPYPGVGEIAFIPVGGRRLTLLGFDLGNWLDLGGLTDVRLYDGAYNPLFSIVGIDVPYPTSHYHFSGPISSDNGLILQFGPEAYNIGIDNVSLEVGAPVPEPAMVLTMLAGLVGLGVLGRRRA